jgi:hypothetical protein
VDVLEIVGVPLVFSSLSMGTEVKDWVDRPGKALGNVIFS